jgi:hypothetical protein
MEIAAAALSSIASTVSTGVSAISAGASSIGTATGLSSLLPSASTAASILSGGATVLSVLNAQRSGEAKAKALELQAQDAETTAGLEAIQGTDRRNSLKAALTQAVGDRDVAAAASGVDLSFGTPSVARQQAIKDGERALAIDQDTQNFRVARLRERAANYRLQASGANAAGLGSAAALALEGGSKLMRRG